MSLVNDTLKKQNKLHIIIFLFMILIIVIISTNSMIHLQQVVDDETESYAKITENNLYTLLNNEINKSIMLTNEIANSTLLHDWIKKYDQGLASGDDITRFLEQKVNTTIAENAVFVSTKSLDDYTNLGFNKTLSKTNAHDAWFFNFINSNKPYMLNIDTEETRNLKKMLFVNRRIEDSSGKLLGVCSIGISFKELNKILENFNQQENVETFLVDTSGTIQFGTKKSTFSKINFEKIIGNKKTPEIAITHENNFHGFTTVQYIRDFDWYMVMFSENNSMDVAFSRFVKNIILIAFLILMICIGCITAFLWQWEKKKLAEYANESKTNFLSRMSHDLRTPMNGIVGMVHIAQENINNPEKVADALYKIENSSKQLQALLNDVLEMSHLESKKIELSHEEFNLRNLLSELAPAIEVLSEQYEVTLAGSHYDINHEWLIASPIHLQRIIQNLLTNALKYNHPGGTLEVWCKEEPITEKRSNFIFTIKDTGIGMSPEFQKHMFDPFTREKTPAAITRNGTGLGMAITKEFLDLLNGTIEVNSKQNVGTCITVTIPMDVLEKQEETASSNENLSLSGLHILLAEDNPLNAEIATYILQEHNAIVTHAINGEDALNKFAESTEGSFHLILMDIMMPEMDGYETTIAIRQLSRSDAQTIPIIAMTANALTEDIKKCLSVGMNGHINKPIDIETLIEKINSNLN